MKELPIKFQMRAYGFPEFTHTVKMNGWGDYEVTWARGFDRLSHSMGGSLPNKVFDVEKVKQFVRNCEWFVIEDKPKQKESADSLPDEFYFKLYGQGCVYKMKRDGDGYHCTDPHAPADEGGHHTYAFTKRTIEEGSWVVCNAPLTAEQQKAVNAFREQIQQLDSSIKINEQDIEHKLRLIANYKQRQNDLLEKIAEITGEDSPSVVKAKEMKAELAKLKKGNV